MVQRSRLTFILKEFYLKSGVTSVTLRFNMFNRICIIVALSLLACLCFTQALPWLNPVDPYPYLYFTATSNDARGTSAGVEHEISYYSRSTTELYRLERKTGRLWQHTYTKDGEAWKEFNSPNNPNFMNRY